MSCPGCEALKEDLRAARAELVEARAGSDTADRLARWMRAFGCSMKQARVLLAFVDQPLRVMDRDRILALTIEDDAGDERLDRSADTRIKDLRKAVAAKLPGRPVIVTLYGLGYALAAGGAVALRGVVGEHEGEART